jgi:hypothetical protein
MLSNIQVIYDTRLFFHRSFYPRFFSVFFTIAFHFSQSLSLKKTGIFIDFCFQLFGSGWMFEGFPPQAPPRPAPQMVCWRPCNLRATAAPRPATPHWARAHWRDAPRRCLGSHGISGCSQGGSHGFPMVFPQIMTKIAGWDMGKPWEIVGQDSFYPLVMKQNWLENSWYMEVLMGKWSINEIKLRDFQLLCLIIGGYWDIFDGYIMIGDIHFLIFIIFVYLITYVNIMGLCIYILYIIKINQALDLGMVMRPCL